MKKVKPAGAMLERYRILSAHDSLFRMDVQTGQTWILSQKELIWREVGRGRRAETNGRSLNESNRFWTFRAFRFRRREISLRSFSNALSLFIAQAPLTPRPERTHGDNAKSNIEPKATGPFNVLKRGGVGWVFYV